MVLCTRVRRGRFLQLSVRFQLAHRTVSWDAGVKANVGGPKNRGRTHSHSLAFDKHPSISTLSSAFPSHSTQRTVIV